MDVLAGRAAALPEVGGVLGGLQAYPVVVLERFAELDGGGLARQRP